MSNTRLGQLLINYVQSKIPEFKFDKNSTSSIDTQVAFYKARVNTYIFNMTDKEFKEAVGNLVDDHGVSDSTQSSHK